VAWLLIIDENLNHRLATELRRRGRAAKSAAELGYKGLKDPELLVKIARDYPGSDAVLVTADDNMPAEHAEILRETRVTLATIDPARPVDLPQEQWEWEVVQRWAHRMAEQESGGWRRYGRSAREWTPPKRPRSPR
jgi:predicted nuclease of predicted toxin-antitoxin system